MGAPTQVTGVTDVPISGALTNGYIGWTPDKSDPSVYTLKGTKGAGAVKGAWSSATAYVVGDVVTNAQGVPFQALVAGTNLALPAAGQANANWTPLYVDPSSLGVTSTTRRPSYFR